MKAQIFNALQEHKHQLAIAYFCLASLSCHHWIKIRSIVVSALLIGMIAALAAFAVCAYISTIVLYLLCPNYFDHVEPTVASISWLWMHGHDLYPNWTTGDVYGAPYGPVIFLITGMALLWKPSIFVSKLPGALALGAGFTATAILLMQKTASGLTSLFLLASLTMLFGLFGVYAFWNRSEPFLILASVLALLLAFRLSPMVAAASVGVLAGIAAGLKLHGFIYTVPAAATALARVETLRGRVVMAIIGSACAVASALLPYFEKGASIVDYLRFLRAEVDSGLSWFLLVEVNLPFTLVLTVPLIGIWIWRRPTLSPPDRWLLAALGVSVAITNVIGAIKGGGGYYILPLVPICMYGIAVLCTSKTEAKKVAALIFVSFFLAYGPTLVWNMRSFKYSYQVAAPFERENIAELQSYLTNYPGAQIGMSDWEHYRSYFYRVFSVWRGRPLHVDFDGWMHLADVGVDEEHIVRFIKGCTVPTWILPLGEPFTISNLYNNRPLFSERFRKTFLTHYSKIETGQAYQVWECKYEFE